MIAFPNQDYEAAMDLGHRHACELKGDMTTAPSLPPAVLALHRKSYNLHTTEPCDGRRMHACLGDTPNLPVSVQAMVLSGISSPLGHQAEVPTEALSAQTLPNAYNHQGGDAALEIMGFNMHLGLSLDIKQLFHKYCLW